MMNPFSWLQMTNMILHQGLVLHLPQKHAAQEGRPSSLVQTNAISEVIVDSNGVPYVLPGLQGCENYRLHPEMGFCVVFLITTSMKMAVRTTPSPMYTNVKNSSLNSAIGILVDLQMRAQI